MDNLNNRKFVGRLIFAVLTGRKNVREAIKLFPETKDPNITCAYHALVHYASDEEMRYQDIDYRELQDDFLEFIAQTLCDGKVLPQNIIDEYKPYYKGPSSNWKSGMQGILKELLKFINI